MHYGKKCLFRSFFLFSFSQRWSVEEDVDKSTDCQTRKVSVQVVSQSVHLTYIMQVHRSFYLSVFVVCQLVSWPSQISSFFSRFFLLHFICNVVVYTTQEVTYYIQAHITKLSVYVQSSVYTTSLLHSVTAALTTVPDWGGILQVYPCQYCYVTDVYFG